MIIWILDIWDYNLLNLESIALLENNLIGSIGQKIQAKTWSIDDYLLDQYLLLE